MNRSNTALDPETRLATNDHDSLRLWLRLFTSTALIERELSLRLKREFDCSLSRFDLLAQLQRTPNGLGMTELSARLLVTGGNITWLVSSLQRDGLVSRGRTAADGRAVLVQLTTAGRRAFGAMARAHEVWVTELLSGISQRDRRALITTLGGVKGRVTEQITQRLAREEEAI